MAVAGQCPWTSPPASRKFLHLQELKPFLESTTFSKSSLPSLPVSLPLWLVFWTQDKVRQGMPRDKSIDKPLKKKRRRSRRVEHVGGSSSPNLVVFFVGVILFITVLFCLLYYFVGCFGFFWTFTGFNNQTRRWNYYTGFDVIEHVHRCPFVFFLFLGELLKREHKRWCFRMFDFDCWFWSCGTCRPK